MTPQPSSGDRQVPGAHWPESLAKSVNPASVRPCLRVRRYPGTQEPEADLWGLRPDWPTKQVPGQEQ